LYTAQYLPDIWPKTLNHSARRPIQNKNISKQIYGNGKKTEKSGQITQYKHISRILLMLTTSIEVEDEEEQQTKTT